MGGFIDRLAELLGVLFVAYTANDTFRAAVLLAVTLLCALAWLALRTYSVPNRGVSYGPLP